MSWWQKNNLRLVQNNLRETDANLDVDRLITDLQALSTNVLMMNGGGIVAFYPTKLEYQYRAEGQTKDLLKEAVEKSHTAGMKFIARFDFSKAHETIFAQKPEWFYRTREGKEVNYHGIVHTCINGYYQREYSLQMIDEVISNYDVDGIFFNMFGYQTRDYSGTNYGICFCDSCKTKFREFSGLDLPLTESLEDPVYRQYKLFQDATTKEMLDRIYELVKSKNKDIAISTYNEHKVDIVRKESNTDNKRPLPVWLYSASENVASLEDSWDDKLVSNCCINAIDLVHRFTGVSSHEVNIRLKAGLASGSGLDFCIIGVFEDYPDRENLPTVASVFEYHKNNEDYYGNFLSMSDVALIKPGKPVQKNMKEYFGIYKMLKEAHIVFDVLDQNVLARKLSSLNSYKAVIIPDISEFSEEELQALESISLQGVSLISTGGSFTAGAANQSFLKRNFDAVLAQEHVHNQEAAYLLTDDKQIFNSFPERDWIFLTGSFYKMEFGASTQKLLPYVIPSTFGPPERASGHKISEQLWGAATNKKGQQTNIYIPWPAGELYYKHGYADHKHVVLNLLQQAIKQPLVLTTNAPSSVEVFFHKLADGSYLLHLLNLSGFNGLTYTQPLPIFDLKITLNGLGECNEAIYLVDQSQAIYANSEQQITIEVPELTDFAAIVIRK
ncbi:family 10 glycosylhydrolase [Paenibacillus sp. S3N08]|uniref:Family 10 glycosylhydrolase n=2 Tax=Paenibacillus agricola TaxID=2716264 RepID=A0ABX0J1B6_9BACL|nr:family 10 glycosylhydrolase [Paenibacillus agricola]